MGRLRRYAMTIARQFTVLIAIPFLLVLALAAALTLQFAALSTEGARLIANLQRTSILNQDLAKGNGEQTDWLQEQFLQPDQSFLERSRILNYSLGEKYMEYLKLDIGDQERLTVETVKSLQSEASILSMQIYEQLQSGNRAGADMRLLHLYQVQGQIRNAFETLNSLQLEKLRAVVEHLNRFATRGLVAMGVFMVALVVAFGAVAVALRRRILQPVRAILEASERMRGGDLAARAPIGQTDEFGQMTQGFNFMAESLAASYGDLERKVEERTRQLREIQDQLVRAEKMSAVGLLVSGVAHELNNPLAAIRGLVELTRMDLKTRERDSKSVQRLEEVDSQVERCRRIIVNLLQFARQQEPHMEVVDLNKAVEQILELRAYEWETTKTTLVREFDPACPRLCADRDKIQQVVLNLVNNAHDAIGETGQPGTIWVRTRLEPPNVVVDVRDTGPGFRDPGRAFDAFYTTKEAGKGTGLGLSVSYGIVHDHGGDIKVGNWAHGGQAIVTLPIGDLKALEASQPAPAPAPEVPQAVTKTPRPLRALVVDDEDMLVRVQIAFLAKMGITGVGAASGEEGIRYLENHHVDLVISDVRMPGAVDGAQLYEWVRQRQPDVARAFLFVSGDVAGLNAGEFFANTSVPRIEKPFQFSEYSKMIRSVLEAGGLLP